MEKSDSPPARDSFLTLLSTDKPIYRPKDKVYVRGVILHSLTLKSVPSDHAQPEAHLKVFAPNGDNIFTARALYDKSVVAAYWEIPSEQSGGDYKLQFTFPYDQGFTGAEREINIRSFRAPRLKTQLKFIQKAYGPGDKALATLEVLRAEGGVPESAIITAVATVDDIEVHRGPVSLDPKGSALITFQLPTTITTGEGTLSCTIQDGGVTETATKTIPITLSTMEVHLYPEGGDLISDVENRFYVEAFTKTKDPADITAEVRDKSTKEVVAMVTTEHEGRGKSSFVPKRGQNYVLHIVKPSGIINEIAFPETKKKGIVVKSKEEAYKGDKIDISLLSSRKARAKVIISKKMWEIDSVEYDLEANVEKAVTLNTKGAHGVLTVTVLRKGKPSSERLVFVRPSQSLQVEIQSERPTYAPGEKVKLHIKTKTETGTPISSNIGIQVTDDAVLELVEKRKQSPRLPAMALLEPEVDQLYDSDLLLSNDKYVDLLLGTQGWRRFITQEKIVGIKEERVLGVHNAKPKPPPVPMLFGGGPPRMMAPGMVARGGPPPRPGGPPMAIPAMAMAPPPMPAPPPMAAMAPPPPAKNMAPPPPAKNMAPAKQMVAEAMPQQQQQQVERRRQAAPVLAKSEAKPAPLARAASPPAPPKPAAKMAPPAPNRMGPPAMGKRPPPPQLQMQAPGVHNVVDEIISQAVREYAHSRGPRTNLDERTDFTETLYWNSVVTTNEKGEATVEFELSDSITTYKAFADCFIDARLGTSSTIIESKNPFYMEPKLPLEVTYGDHIQASIALVNESQTTVEGTIKAEILGTGLKIEPCNLDFSLKTKDRQRKVVPIKVGDVAEISNVKVSALTDSVTRPLTIVPNGFPFNFSAGGILEKNTTRTHDFTIPSTIVPNSFETNVKAFTTPASTLTESLKGFIREPYGCFEQTSMTTYPLVMALRYFTTHTGIDPSIVESATEMLGKGYLRLTSYECKSGGYEWFGGDPAHEALTAYGVLQFTEMQKVYPVDSAMLQRTTDWLLKRRDGKGGFERSSRALDQFGGAPKDTTNAYIVWALTEAGIKVDKEVEGVISAVKDNGYKDSYLLSLLTITLYRLNRKDEAASLAEKLAKMQGKDGSVTDAAATITMSGGSSRTIEATSLSILSWLNDHKFNENVELALKYLQSQCSNGSYGSTQSTVLALKAIVTYDELRSSPPAEGSIIVRLDGKEVSSLGFSKTTTGTLVAPSFAEALSAGKHVIEIEMLEGGKMPYTVSIDYFSVSGASSAECSVDLKTKLNTGKVNEGEVVRMNVIVENKKDEVLPMTVAIVGVPGGLEVRHDQLKEFVKSESVAFYETKGRDIVFYWRYFGKNEKKELNVDLIAAVPGKYTGPASRAYLYYTNEHKVWNDGATVEIVSK